MTATRRRDGSLAGRRAILTGAALLAAAALLVACGGNPNDDIETEEFFRSASPAETEPAPPAETPAAPEEDAPPAPPAEATDEVAPPPDAAAAESDEIVRRYLNDTYGFSLELVCPPFCDATSNGVDRVSFLSDDSGAIVDVSVINPEALQLSPGLTSLQAEWEQRRNASPTFAILNQEEVALPSDGATPALLIDWLVDQRAGGGSLLQFQTLIVQVGPLGYFIDTGVADEQPSDVQDALVRARNTFIARTNPASLPGLYTKWGFVLPYNPASVTQELGNPTATFDLGIFEQRALDSLPERFLTWESVSADLFAPDQAITDVATGLQDGGVQVTENERGDLALPDLAGGRFTINAVTFPNGLSGQLGIFAWYCRDSGRSFVLQSFSREDARAIAQTSLDGFRCSAP